MATKTNNNENTIRIVGVIILIAFGLFYFGGNLEGLWPKKGGETKEEKEQREAVEASVFAAPSPALQKVVQPVIDTMQGEENLIDLAWFYHRMGEAIKSHPQTSEQARLIHLRGGEELSKAVGVTYHPKLEPVLEKIFREHIGLTAKKLTQSDRDKLADLFKAVAWAIYSCIHDKSVMIFDQGELYVCNEDGCSPNEIATDYKGNKLPPYMTHGMVMDPVTDSDVRQSNLDHFSVYTPPSRKGYQEPPQDEKDYPMGLMFDPKELEQWNREGVFMAEIPLGDATGKTRLLYKALKRFDSKAYEEEAQTTGDCTSHAFRNAADTSRAYEIEVKDQPEDFVARGATEAIYGWRGFSGQGMSPYKAAEFLTKAGGVALRQKYGDVDLRTYNADFGIDWGRRGGTPKQLRELLTTNQMQKAALVSSVEEARDAIYAGYALAVGSDVGFDSRRNEFGISKPKGSWMHCMAWVAVTTSQELIGSGGDSPCFLIVNSWGEWNGGPEGEFDIPAGSFWITEDVARKMIAQKMSFAIGEFVGFEAKPLPDFGFSYLSIKVEKKPHGPEKVSGIIESSVGTTMTLNKVDVTLPDGSGGSDDSGGGETPNKCSRCNGSGQHKPDGVWRDCTGDKGNNFNCPFVKSRTKVKIKGSKVDKIESEQKPSKEKSFFRQQPTSLSLSL